MHSNYKCAQIIEANKEENKNEENSFHDFRIKLAKKPQVPTW